MNKPATQSSTYDSTLPASNAVDGDRTSFSHTTYEAQAWFEVDLQSIYNLDMISILQRQDCCQNRLSNFYVLVSDAPFSSTDLNTARLQTGVSSYYFAGQAGPQPSFYIGRTGRYVRVQLTGSDALHIAELQVFDSDSGIDVALSSRGGVASASTTYSNAFNPSNPIDGNRAFGGYWNNAGYDGLPDWWQVQLPLPQQVGQLNVFTLQDSPQNSTDVSLGTPFTTDGVTDFDVQYWTGSVWQTVSGGHVTGNNRVWRQFNFTPVITDRFRVVVYGAQNHYARLMEFEAIAVTANGIVNGSFEVPPLGAPYAIQDGAQWVFILSSGISQNSTAFTGGNPDAPDGGQVAFIQGASSIQQAITLSAGSYMLHFKAAQRSYSQSGVQTLQVLIDGVAIGSYQPPGLVYSQALIPFVINTVGSHTIALTGVGSGGDYTAFVDDVQITAPPITTLIAELHLDENSWTGAPGEAADSSGSFHPGNALGTPMPTSLSADPPLPGSPGSCRYATLSGGAFDVPGLPVSTAPGDATTVTFWLNWNGTDDAIPISWPIFDLWFYAGKFGFNTGQSDIFGISSNGLANGWHHVAAVFVNGSVAGTLYIDGISQSLSTQFGTPQLGNAFVSSQLRIGNFTADGGHGLGGSIDEVRVYNGAITQAQVIAAMNASHPCAVASMVSAFNAFESATAAGSITGVIHTKVSGASFGVDVVALNPTRDAVLASFTGDVKVEILNAADNSGALDDNACRSTWVSVAGGAVASMAFTVGDAGRKSITLTEPGAWRDLRLRITTPATGTPTAQTCSADDFAVRPASFISLSASDADAASAGTARSLANAGASGGIVHKAGQPFTLGATAVDSLSATASSYDGTPTLLTTTCSGTACRVATVGGLGVLSSTPTAVAGVISRTASYSDVGAFSLQLSDTSFTAVDAADGSSSAERTFSSNVVNVGRFVPDHFDLTLLAAPVLRTFDSATCGSRSFTYLGQPFGYASLAEAKVLARNAMGQTTANYRGALWKLTSASLIQSFTTTPASPTLDASAVSAAALTSNGDGTGLLIGSAADKISFNRPAAAPVAPFDANIALGWGMQDSSEAAVGGNGVISTPTPLMFSSIAFDSGNQIRFGLLRLSPAYGSELIDLPVRIDAQYWDGQRMALNAADQCTALPAASLAMSNYQRNLAPCKTAFVGNLTLNGGHVFAKLRKPGAGNNGGVDISLQLGASPAGQTCTSVGPSSTPTVSAGLPWLQGKWNGAPRFDQNPSTRASFGQYRSPLIYQREAF